MILSNLIKENAKVSVGRKVAKGLAKAGLATLGYIAGSKVTAKTIGKLDPYKDIPEPKKAKKEENKADIAIKGIKYLNPYFTTKKVKRIKKTAADISSLAKPHKKLNEKVVKALAKGAKKALKYIGSHKKSVAKTVGGGLASGAAWGAAETASHVANRKVIDKAALSQASKDVEYELKRKHGKKKASKVFAKAKSRVVKRRARKAANESRKLSKAAKIGLAVTGAVGADIMGELGAEAIRKKYRAIKAKKKATNVSEATKAKLKKAAADKAKDLGKKAGVAAITLGTLYTAGKLTKNLGRVR